MTADWEPAAFKGTWSVALSDAGLGCTDEELFPVLVDPTENRYSCSGIPTNQEGQEVTSTW